MTERQSFCQSDIGHEDLRRGPGCEKGYGDGWSWRSVRRGRAGYWCGWADCGVGCGAGRRAVGLFEKGEFIGGTTALSGAVCWIPNNRHMLEAGLDDSREDALRCLESLSHGLINPELAAAFVDTAPQVIDSLEESTDLTFQLVAGFQDYHPENPGGEPGGGRSLDPGVFSYQQLGSWVDRVVMHNRNAFGTLIDIPLGGGAGIPEEVLSYRQEHDMRGGGPALVGALLHELVKLRVEPVTEARAVELRVRDGRGRGVAFDTPNGRIEVSTGAVVLATGGFEWDQQLVRDFLRGPIDVPSWIPTNTGDGLRMAMAAGSALGNMREAWWVPVAFVPGERTSAASRCTTRSVSVTYPGRSSSTGTGTGSPTRPRTTTPSAAPCTTSTRCASTTPTCRAG